MKEFVYLKVKHAFTLTEVLIAVAIVGIIAGLVLPKLIENYQTKTMDSAFRREVQTIEDSINGLAVSENKADFFSTMMYKDTTPENYDDSSGAYMEKYLRTSKMCDNPKDCFAPTYYQYEAGKSRKEYKPDYKGACAILKNGMSICMIPQIGAANITGIIDLNGKKGPNVLDRDLRTFSIAAKTRVGLNQDTEGVRKLDWDNIKGGEEEPEIETPPTPPTPDNPCVTNSISLECCKFRGVSNRNDPCCTYAAIKATEPVCLEEEIVEVHASCTRSVSSVSGLNNYDFKANITCTLRTSPKGPAASGITIRPEGHCVSKGFQQSGNILSSSLECYLPSSISVENMTKVVITRTSGLTMKRMSSNGSESFKYNLTKNKIVN